jgi:hypothetical protein
MNEKHRITTISQCEWGDLEAEKNRYEGYEVATHISKTHVDDRASSEPLILPRSRMQQNNTIGEGIITRPFFQDRFFRANRCRRKKRLERSKGGFWDRLI